MKFFIPIQFEYLSHITSMELCTINQMNINKYFLLNSQWDKLQVLMSIPNINEYGWLSIKIHQLSDNSLIYHMVTFYLLRKKIYNTCCLQRWTTLYFKTSNSSSPFKGDRYCCLSPAPEKKFACKWKWQLCPMTTFLFES